MQTSGWRYGSMTLLACVMFVSGCSDATNIRCRGDFRHDVDGTQAIERDAVLGLDVHPLFWPLRKEKHNGFVIVQYTANPYDPTANNWTESMNLDYLDGLDLNAFKIENARSEYLSYDSTTGQVYYSDDRAVSRFPASASRRDNSRPRQLLPHDDATRVAVRPLLGRTVALGDKDFSCQFHSHEDATPCRA